MGNRGNHRWTALVVGAAALVVVAAMSAQPVYSNHAGFLELGHDANNNLANTTTELGVAAGQGPADGLRVFARATGGTGLKAVGQLKPGVEAISHGNIGVLGRGFNAVGAHGVHGIANHEQASGVLGESIVNGIGVSGKSKSIGVSGQSTGGGTGVRGGAGGIGVLGEVEGGDFQSVGVLGNAATSDGTGVQGLAFTGDAIAVLGHNTAGGLGVKGTSQFIAVEGQSTGVVGSGATGVHGTAADVGVVGEGGRKGLFGSGSAIGVDGTSPNGIGVQAGSSGTGTALKVDGKSTFSRSGKLTIPSGASSVTKTGISLTPASMVLATLQQNRAGVWVQAAVPNPSAGTFTVILNKAVTATTTVAYFVLS